MVRLRHASHTKPVPSFDGTLQPAAEGHRP
jgi:hypothetical protein